MDRLLTFQYYFTPRPDPNFAYTKVTLGLVALLIVGALALKLLRKHKLKDDIWKKIIRPIPPRLFNFGLALLLLLLFRETGIPYLSMRLWWVLWGVLFLYVLLKLLFGCKNEYLKRSERHHLNARLSQYLPKKR